MGRPFQRVLVLLLSAACLLAAVPAPRAVSAYDAPEASEFDTYTSQIHWGPAWDSVVVGQLENGSQLQILGQSGEFYRINSCGMQAYIAKHQVIQRTDGEYYVNCDINSPETLPLPCYNAIEARLLRATVLEWAKAQLGTPYVYGGSSPGGFDCSGFTCYIYEQLGIALSRGGSSQPGNGVVVAQEDLQAGDLVFFRVPGEIYVASHVGIYVGDGQIIHAGSSGGVSYAQLDSPWFKDYYLCARRILNVTKTGIVASPAITADSALAHDSTGSGLRTSN